MHLYKTRKGNILLHENKAYLNNDEWDTLVNQENLFTHLMSLTQKNKLLTENNYKDLFKKELLAPIETQELWAAGVTYMRSRDARIEESKDKGGADCYERVYTAERPELFFKSLPHRVSGPGEVVFIRKDSTWNVPEPELTLFINSQGKIQAYTIGNDMSSRSIEGQNPLYLPQAKIYERSAALGPCLYVPENPISANTNIILNINRDGKVMFDGLVTISRMKRQLTDLADWLFSELTFSSGCFLMTGTGLVPPDGFSLQPGDLIEIKIDNIGTLTNRVAIQSKI